jgi:uncharacterized protein YkwD
MAKHRFFWVFIVLYLPLLLPTPVASQQAVLPIRITTPSAEVLAEQELEIEQQIVDLVNAYRKQQQLKPLEINLLANRIAKAHSQNMAEKKVAVGHDGFNQRADKLERLLDYNNSCSENVAMGYLNAETVVKGWIASAVHQKNIVGNYSKTGIGVRISAEGVLYFTQVFY